MRLSPRKGIWAHRSTQTQAELGQNRQICPRPSEQVVFKRRFLYKNNLFEIKEPFLEFNPSNYWILLTLNHRSGSKKRTVSTQIKRFSNESKLSRKTAGKHTNKCVKAEVKTLYSHLLKGIVKARVRSHTHKKRLRHTKKSIFQVWAAMGELHDCKKKKQKQRKITTTQNKDNKIKNMPIRLKLTRH